MNEYEMTPDGRLPLYPLGAHVRLYGTCGDVYTVTASRPARHGAWYTFRCGDFGDRCDGYGGMVREVIALPVEA